MKRRAVWMTIFGAMLTADSLMGATLTNGYTTGAGSQLLSINGGSGSVLFTDTAVAGGNDIANASGTAAWNTVLLDGTGHWEIGETVQITGMALPIKSSSTSGTFTFDILKGVGGSGDSGAGGLASLGTATASYDTALPTDALYVNFDTPVSFAVDAGSTKIGIKFTKTNGQLDYKAQSTEGLLRYNADDGSWVGGTTSPDMRFSVAGTVSIANIPPVFSANVYSQPDAAEGVLYSSTVAGSASDANTDPLTYSKVAGSFSGSGSDWLTVGSGGSLTGTPGSANVGRNRWTIQVDDGNGGTDTATLHIFVVSKTAGQGTRPNILYILADDLGYLDIGANDEWASGDLEFATPRMDSIFSGGARFRAALVSNAVCAPSRAGLLTGRSGSRFGFESNFNHDYSDDPRSRIGLHPDQETIADILKAVGYKTFCIGKWHLGDNEDLFHPNLRGFDEFYGIIGGSRNYVKQTGLPHDKVIMSNHVAVAEPSDMYVTDFFTDQALDCIEDQTTNNSGQPWFMYMSFTAPHGPMDAKAVDMDRIPVSTHTAFEGTYTKTVPVMILETNGTITVSAEDDNRYLRRVYGAMTVSMDDNVGRLLDKLSELGIAENTLVVFHSDNGGPLKGKNWSLNAPLRGAKGSLWEGGIRVPFAIRWPGTILTNQVFGHDVPVSSLDLTPTFAAISGADQVQEIRTDGINLMPLLLNRTSTTSPRKLYWRRGTMLQVATRSGDWKYYKNRNTGDEYLFDHGNNANEYSGDQADSNPTKLAELAAEYAAFEDTLADAHWNSNGELLAITTYDLDDAEAGVAYSMPLTCSVPRGTSPTVTWSITAGKPGWLSMDSATGTLSGTPTGTDPKYNTITLQISADGETSTYKVPLTVVGGHDPDDTDGDGLPDAWEVAQFTNLTTTAGGESEDQDGDGTSDRSEYVEGTDANDPGSYFTVPITLTGSVFSVTVDGKTGRDYALHTRTNLIDDGWGYADSLDNLSGDGPVTLQANVPEGLNAFYGRVKVDID